MKKISVIEKLCLLKNLFKSLILVFILMISCTLSAQFTNKDFLEANGTVLCNDYGQGDTINLRGTNLGSWLSMEYWVGPMGTGSLDRSSWQATAYDTYYDTDAQNIFDRDLSTRWSNGEAQVSDSSQYLIVDMQENVLFNRILIETGDYSGDYPKGYDIYLSEDGDTWESVASGDDASDTIDVELSNVYYKRYVKIVQTGEDDEHFWSIAEFNLFMEDDYSVRNSLILRFGEDGMDELLDYFQDLWITESDLDTIAAMGMNMVRVPIYWMELMNNEGEIKENGFDQLDWLIEQCKEREIYVILDLHGAPGGLNGYITSGQSYFNELWTNSEDQQETKDIWEAIATRYADEPTVAAYDLMNEPYSSDSENYPISWFYNELYDVVRDVDTAHVISVQAFPSFDYIESPETYGWENVMYQVHNYDESKEDWDSQDGFIDAVLLQLANYKYNWNVPILAGEFNFWDFPDLWAKYLDGLNELNVSWSNWCYKVKRVDSPKQNWGYYDSNTNEIPDMHYDSIEEIEAKWDKFATSYFNENDTLKDIVSAYTDAPLAYVPYNSSVWFLGNNDLYVSSEGGDNPMTCTREDCDGWELFTVVDAGDNKVAIQCSDGRYLSLINDGDSVCCNSYTIDSLQQFDWINVGDSLVALRGYNGKYLCSRNGESVMTCDIDEIAVWESFTWGYGSSVNTSSVSTSSIYQTDEKSSEEELSKSNDDNILVYPNPVSQILFIKADFKIQKVKILNESGQLVMQLNFNEYTGSIDTSSLSNGVYFVNINGTCMKKILVLK